MSGLPGAVRRGLYFSLQRGIGSCISETWREFQRWESFSTEQLQEAVEERLSVLLNCATSESSYYRDLGLSRHPNETAYDFLKRFPILSREKLREDFSKIVVDKLTNQITAPSSKPGGGYNWLVVKTGGTTGIPTSVVHDPLTRDWGRATRLYSAQQCGFPLGTRYFRLWGSEQDLLKTEATLQARVLQNLLGEIPLNAFRAKESELRQHYSQMRQQPQIKHLMAYVDAAVSLASFIKDQKLRPPSFKTVMACAGTVTQEWREILQNTFSADILDKYGSRECCDIACECSFHTGLHVYSPNVFVEVVNDSGGRCAQGETGRILVTMLNNYSFPMIRYEIGDIGEWGPNESCECGLVFPRIKSIEGRQDDMLVTEDGTLLSSVFVRHFVGVSLNRQIIREWQLEQTGQNQFSFRFIAASDNGLAHNLSAIKEAFQSALGHSAQINFSRVSEIAPTSTGKLRWVVNSWKRN